MTNIRPIHCCIFLLALGLPLALRGDETADNPPAAEADAETPKARQKPTTYKERAAARRAARDSVKNAKNEEERKKWLARLEARDVTPWPENETEEQHTKALEKSREMVSEALTLFPGTEQYETESFIVVSNIPPQQIGPYIASLDRMYEYMCKLYGVEQDHKVWLGGKAPIFAFLEKPQFEAFEERFYPEARESLREMTNIYGLCHMKGTGEVAISCYRGNDPHNFGQMLVHETSHGFIHRYKTKVKLPNWVDEGMADLVGAEMVPSSTTVKNRELKAIQQLAQQGSFAGMLSAKRIESQHYGMASNLNRFLLQTNRGNYVAFIEALKEGQKWEEALQTAYKSTPDQLLTAYARWINVAELRP
jgi:hypothetical protein